MTRRRGVQAPTIDRISGRTGVELRRSGRGTRPRAGRRYRLAHCTAGLRVREPHRQHRPGCVRACRIVDCAAGLLTIQPSQQSAPEHGTAYFDVFRNPYSVGIVTVTVRVAGGSATPGRDFASPGQLSEWRDVLVTFQSGETYQQVPVWIARDENNEQPETLTLEIVSPTGGAALGSQTTATVTIEDAGGISSGSLSGGGSLGWFAALLLTLGGGLRRLLTNDRERRPSA